MATQCPKCQTENPDTLKFCGECGTHLTRRDKSQSIFTKTIETLVEGLAWRTSFTERYEIIDDGDGLPQRHELDTETYNETEEDEEKEEEDFRITRGRDFDL